MLSQEFLRDRHRRRIGAAGMANAAGAATRTAVVVLRDFDPPTFTAAALEFVAGLPSSVRDAWRADFTRTVFLAGNPANLAARFSFRQIAADGSVAWHGPVEAGRATGLRRLLRAVRGGGVAGLPTAQVLVLVPGQATGPPGHREVHVATAGLTVPDYLVHLHHLLAEAVIGGLVRPGDRLLLRHVRQIDLRPDQVAEVRVHRGAPGSGLLRAYACLTTETTPARPGGLR